MQTYNIQETYVYEGEKWPLILVAASFLIGSTENRLKVHSLGQLLCGRDIILSIKHTVIGN